MNSDAIFEVIQDIAATPGKNDKIALVAKHIGDEDFARVLRGAYHPLTTYGVRKLRPLSRAGTGEFGQGTRVLLEVLASRELTGNAALEAIQAEMERLTAFSGALLQRIILRDLRAGFDAETCNKAKKGFVPDFPYMRCSLPKKVKMDTFFADGAISQEKADGMFLNLDHTADGEVMLRTRQGNELPLDQFKALVLAARSLVDKRTELHGEMLVLRDGKVCAREDGNGVLNHVAAGGDFAENERPLFMAWDQIDLDCAVPKGRDEIPYKARLAALADQLLENGSYPGFNERMAAKPLSKHLALIESRWVKNLEQAMAHYREKLLARKEGTVVKKAHAIWRDGTSTEQIKLKLKVPFEARITGFEEGTGKNAGKLSKLRCRSECGQLEFGVACRGDAMINEVTDNPSKWQDAVITCEGNAIMPPSDSNPLHSIFLPIFVERRTDKSVADTLERVREQFENAMEGA